MREQSILAGDDGKFSTAQIVAALFQSQSPRDQKDLQHAELLRVQTENAKRERIPVTIVLEVWDAATQAAAATLKAAKGKNLTPAKINEILGHWREAKLPLKW